MGPFFEIKSLMMIAFICVLHTLYNSWSLVGDGHFFLKNNIDLL